MKEIKTKQELEEILNSEDSKRICIKIGAPWCGPCSQIQRTILDIEGAYTDDYILDKLLSMDNYQQALLELINNSKLKK